MGFHGRPGVRELDHEALQPAVGGIEQVARFGHAPRVAPLSRRTARPAPSRRPVLRFLLECCGGLGRHGMARLPPGMHATKERSGIFELAAVFFGPPGRRGFLRSGAIEDDFLVLANGGSKLIEFLEAQRTGKAKVLALLFVVVGAHQEGMAIA